MPSFRGLASWEVGSEIIYCEETELGLLDLHNCCDLLSTAVLGNPDAGIDLTLTFVTLEASGRQFQLTFGDVSELELRSVPEVINEDTRDFFGLDYWQRHGEAGIGNFEVRTGILEVGFRASMVLLTVNPTRS